MFIAICECCTHCGFKPAKHVIISENMMVADALRAATKVSSLKRVTEMKNTSSSKTFRKTVVISSLLDFYCQIMSCA